MLLKVQTVTYNNETALRVSEIGGSVCDAKIPEKKGVEKYCSRKIDGEMSKNA